MIVLYISLFILIYILSLYLKNKAVFLLKEIVNNLNKETENILKLFKEIQEQPQKIKEGNRIKIDTEMEIIGQFFHEDVKYGIIVPVILDKFADLPGIIKIENDKWSVEFQGSQYNKDMEIEIINKSIKIYMDYRKSNPNKFLKNSMGQE